MDDPDVEALAEDRQFQEAAAVIIVELATGPEPISGDEGLFRSCTLCEGQPVTTSSSVRHFHDCPWKRAKELMAEMASR